MNEWMDRDKKVHFCRLIKNKESQHERSTEFDNSVMCNSFVKTNCFAEILKRKLNKRDADN